MRLGNNVKNDAGQLENKVRLYDAKQNKQQIIKWDPAIYQIVQQMQEKMVLKENKSEVSGSCAIERVNTNIGKRRRQYEGEDDDVSRRKCIRLE